MHTEQAVPPVEATRAYIFFCCKVDQFKTRCFVRELTCGLLNKLKMIPCLSSAKTFQYREFLFEIFHFLYFFGPYGPFGQKLACPCPSHGLAMARPWAPGPGPQAPGSGPGDCGKHLTKRTSPEQKRVYVLNLCGFMGKKRCRTSPRSLLWCQKTKVSVVYEQKMVASAPRKLRVGLRTGQGCSVDVLRKLA